MGWVFFFGFVKERHFLWVNYIYKIESVNHFMSLKHVTKLLLRTGKSL